MAKMTKNQRKSLKKRKMMKKKKKHRKRALLAKTLKRMKVKMEVMRNKKMGQLAPSRIRVATARVKRRKRKRTRRMRRRVDYQDQGMEKRWL